MYLLRFNICFLEASLRLGARGCSMRPESPVDRYPPSLPPPSLALVLPALTHLKYRGTSKYLDNFVARIDAPHLGDIDIIFFSQPMIDASQLGQFIERVDLQTSLTRAEIETSEHAISVSFNNSSTSAPLRLRISCRQSDWQLFCMAQICEQFFPFLFCVRDVGINTTQSSSGQDGVGGDQWLELISAFGGAQDCHVAGEQVTEILCALCPADGLNMTDTAVLPALHILRVEKPIAMGGPSWEAVQSFVTTRGSLAVSYRSMRHNGRATSAMPRSQGSRNSKYTLWTSMHTESLAHTVATSRYCRETIADSSKGTSRASESTSRANTLKSRAAIHSFRILC